jgi:hypothetical protein
VLARNAGLTSKAFAAQCQVSFVKVAEFQRRAVVHFHGLIRLDAPGDGFAPPELNLSADDLAAAIAEAVSLVRLVVDMPDRTGLILRFGEQTDTQAINGGVVGELTPERAAAYIAKYATKAADDFGLTGGRLTPDALPSLDVSAHIARVVWTCWQLGEHDGYEGLRRWLHMLGFRGHFASKSRRYSTTLGALRNERREYRRRQAAEQVRELLGDDETTLVISRWDFAGVGYLTNGDVALALSAAARARERRRAAHDAARNADY